MTIKHVATTTKRLVAVGGVTFGLIGIGLSAGLGTAAAVPKPDTGSYDEQTDLAQDQCWGAVKPRPVAWKIGHPRSAGCVYAR
jgi:hypothetical protein